MTVHLYALSFCMVLLLVVKQHMLGKYLFAEGEIVYNSSVGTEK